MKRCIIPRSSEMSAQDVSMRAKHAIAYLRAAKLVIDLGEAADVE